jgi:hypothetical protein
MPEATTDSADAFPVTERNRVRRLHHRMPHGEPRS